MAIDYVDDLEAILELGLWQWLLLALLSLSSATSAMSVFMWVFTAYEPAMRCYVPGCELDNPEYAAFSNFSLPRLEGTVSECYKFKRENESLSTSCQAADFTKVRPIHSLFLNFCHLLPLSRFIHPFLLLIIWNYLHLRKSNPAQDGFTITQWFSQVLSRSNSKVRTYL